MCGLDFGNFILNLNLSFNKEANQGKDYKLKFIIKEQ